MASSTPMPQPALSLLNGNMTFLIPHNGGVPVLPPMATTAAAAAETTAATALATGRLEKDDDSLDDDPKILLTFFGITPETQLLFSRDDRYVLVTDLVDMEIIRLNCDPEVVQKEVAYPLTHWDGDLLVTAGNYCNKMTVYMDDVGDIPAYRGLVAHYGEVSRRVTKCPEWTGLKDAMDGGTEVSVNATTTQGGHQTVRSPQDVNVGAEGAAAAATAAGETAVTGQAGQDAEQGQGRLKMPNPRVCYFDIGL